MIILETITVAKRSKFKPPLLLLAHLTNWNFSVLLYKPAHSNAQFAVVNIMNVHELVTTIIIIIIGLYF